MTLKKLLFLFPILFVASLIASAANADSPQTVTINSESGSKTWEVSANGANFLMRQIPLDQLKAFYISRGFSLKQIEPYTSSCVFMTVLRNDNASAGLHFKRDNLKVSQAGKTHPLISVEEWLERLSKVTDEKPPLIAFRWAQFPIDQVFEPGGDWNQGMISVGLPPESKFVSEINWEIEGKPFTIKLEGVECAK